MIREEISISKNIVITNHRIKNINNTKHITKNQAIEIKIHMQITMIMRKNLRIQNNMIIMIYNIL